MIFLENHGVFVASDTTEGIKRIYEDIVSKISAKIIIMPNMSPIDYEIKAVNEIKSLLLKNGCDISKFLTNVEIRELTKSKTDFEPASSVYTPDHMVYCGADAVFIDNKDELAEMLVKLKLNNQSIPRVISIKNIGVFACGKNEKTVKTTAMLFLDTVKIAVLTKSFGQYQFLSDEMIAFIGNWEAEKYRSSVNL